MYALILGQMVAIASALLCWSHLLPGFNCDRLDDVTELFCSAQLGGNFLVFVALSRDFRVAFRRLFCTSAASSVAPTPLISVQHNPA